MKMKIMKKFEALEEERKKIQVFRRELPLCLELVNEAIEKCKKEMQCHGEKSDCEEEILNNEGPILEQFLPLKRTNSSSFDKQQQQQKVREEEEKIDEKKMNLGIKVDWLKSVQLWTADPPLKQDFLVENSTKIELKKCGGGGAFQPFQSETTKGGNTNSIISRATPTTTANSIDMSNNTPPSVAAAAATTSSTADNNSSNGNKRKRSGDDQEEKENERRKTRRCWSPELHKRFLEALQQLGGSHVATPKQIKELMKVDGLTNDEVKSHLQKYRIHTRGGVQNSAATHNAQHQPPPQFVVVGGIWVPPPPPPEYATTMAEAGTKRMNTNDMYVALSAQQVAGWQQQQQQQQHQSPTGSLHSEGRSKQGDHSSVDDVHSSSPSSSTETTTRTSSSKHVK
ncbi:hypothetical protein C5167_025409 [Papaver somniferum]|uniref:HTH myb-type domain-containing protein n=1 Tax=Papaver somniferum TaxID=3469 RepID=A0A4Y7JUD2_PAPSO|nr:transcription factor HHO2-like [Papaver somniferum]RZC63652.1 hypothetical protein C5167_025409 [Papaver somniferum]